jgi:hypothetical protein
MMATEEGGQLVSRPMASYGHAEDGRIYFITHLDNNIARPGATVPVNLAYADADKNSYPPSRASRGSTRTVKS